MSTIDDGGRVRAWVDGEPTEEMVADRERSVRALCWPGCPDLWSTHTSDLARAAFESGWDAAVTMAARKATP